MDLYTTRHDQHNTRWNLGAWKCCIWKNLRNDHNYKKHIETLFCWESNSWQPPETVTYRNPWCFQKCHYQVAINHRCQGGVKGSATTTFAIHSICDDRCHSLGDSKSRLEDLGENCTVYRNVCLDSLVWYSWEYWYHAVREKRWTIENGRLRNSKAVRSECLYSDPSFKHSFVRFSELSIQKNTSPDISSWNWSSGSFETLTFHQPLAAMMQTVPLDLSAQHMVTNRQPCPWTILDSLQTPGWWVRWSKRTQCNKLLTHILYSLYTCLV